MPYSHIINICLTISILCNLSQANGVDKWCKSPKIDLYPTGIVPAQDSKPCVMCTEGTVKAGQTYEKGGVTYQAGSNVDGLLCPSLTPTRTKQQGTVAAGMTCTRGAPAICTKVATNATIVHGPQFAREEYQQLLAEFYYEFMHVH
eukprot:746525_1